MERVVIDQAIQDFTESTKSTRNGLLCAVFIRPDNDREARVLENMVIMGNECEWAMLIYAGENITVSHFCTATQFPSKVIYCALVPESFSAASNGTTRVIPKSVLYQHLLPYLPKYKRIFMMDEDISLNGRVNLQFFRGPKIKIQHLDSKLK